MSVSRPHLIGRPRRIIFPTNSSLSATRLFDDVTLAELLTYAVSLGRPYQGIGRTDFVDFVKSRGGTEQQGKAMFDRLLRLQQRLQQ